MESGQNKLIQPLLTIAIPTWNRSKQLSEALRHLLPQIEKYPDKIEFIICDNASTDDTITLVNDTLTNNPKITYQLFQQKENTGFFGNFHKCISLGTGKYFWLLSDDDFVFDGVIDELINILEKGNVGAVFLNDWTGDILKKENFSCQYANQLEFFSDRPYRHSLISGIIYRHNIHGDDLIFKLHKGNALIGYDVYLKSIYEYNRFAILKGNSLLTRNDYEVRFNGLRIFTIDLSECLKLAKEYYPQNITDQITNSFLKNNIYNFYKEFKYFRNYKENKNNTLLNFKTYINYKYFWLKIVPLIICPKIIFVLQRKIRKLPYHLN